MMLLKRTLFCVFGVLQCVYVVRCSKKFIIFHTLYIIVAPLCSAFLKRAAFLQISSFCEVRRALIGQLSSGL